MAINPFTGLEEDDPTGFAGAPPASMPAPAPAPLPIPQTGDGTMAPGAVPEVQNAQQLLAQVDAVLAPGGAGGGGAGAPVPPGNPPAGQPAAPVQPPPLSGLMTGTTGQQRQKIQGQQVANLEAGRQLDQREAELTQRAGDVTAQVKTTDADQANLQAINAQGEEDERQQVDNLFATRQQEAQRASEQARQAWLDKKPSDWFQQTDAKGNPVFDAKGQAVQDDGKMLLTSLGIALAHMADELNRGRGIQSNIGQQAMNAIDRKVEQHRLGEVAKIENLHQKAIAAGQDEQRLGIQRAAALARVEDKYAGINKRLEAEARAQRAQMGMDAAGIERDQAVLLRARKTLESEQRALTALNGFVDRATALEIQQQRANRVGRGKGGKGGPTDPNDPYAGLTPNQRYLAERRDAESEILGLNGEVLGKARGGPKAAKELGDAQASALVLSDLSNRMKEWYQEHGTVEVLNRAAVQEREGIIVDAAAALTVLKRTGVLNDSERKQYARVFDASAFSSAEEAGKALDQMVRRTNDNYMRQVGSQLKGGAEPMQQAVSQQPAANRVLPAGAEAITYRGVEGYRILKGTNAQGKKVYEFVPWPGQ